MAEIDVLIPVYNAEATLEASLKSILAQEGAAFRLVLVDDGSTDSSPAKLARFAEDPRVTLLRTENQGVAAALNAGLALCEAPLVARFDADDIAYPQRLKVQAAYLAAHPDCVAVGADVDHIDGAGAPILGHPRPGDPGEADPTWAPAREPYLIHPFLMARRAALLAAGGYRRLKTSQDSDLYWRLQRLGRLHNLPERLGQYRIHAESVSGARIQKGRVMAICSQLAALSAARAARGEADLAFPILHPLFEAPESTLEDLAQAMEPRLTPEEKAPFRLAIGAKLMELTTYRPYELELSDCRFIAGTLPEAAALRPENRAQFAWYRSVVAARLLRQGQGRAAAILTGPAGLPKALVRAAAHILGMKASA